MVGKDVQIELSEGTMYTYLGTAGYLPFGDKLSNI